MIQAHGDTLVVVVGLGWTHIEASIEANVLYKCISDSVCVPHFDIDLNKSQPTTTQLPRGGTFSQALERPRCNALVTDYSFN